MMKIRHKKIVASGTAVALAGILGVGALLQSSISVQASPAMMPGIEQIVNDTTAEKPFKILEIVDNTSEAEIGYYVSGQEPYVKLYSYTYKYKENNEEKEKTIKFKTLEEGLKKLPTEELRKEFATNMNTGIKNIQSSSYQAGSADSEENYPLSYSEYQEKYFLSDSDDTEKWQKINFQKIDGSGNSRTDTVKIKGNYRENTAGTGDYTKQEQQYYPIRQDDNDDKAKPEKYRENIRNFYYADNNTADAPYFLKFQEVDNNIVNQAFDTNHNKINNNLILNEYDYSNGNYGYYENVYSDLTAEIVQNIQNGNYTFPGENPALSSEDEKQAVKIPDNTNTRAVNAKSFSDGNDAFSSINEADADNTVDANTQADTQPDVSSDGSQASQPANSSSPDAFSTGDFSDGISDSADGNIENSDISQAQAADTASTDTDFNSATDTGTDFSADANAAAQTDSDSAQDAMSVENDDIQPIINYSEKKDKNGNVIKNEDGVTELDAIGTSANPKVYYGVTIDQYPYYKYTLISDMKKIVACANANAGAVKNGTFTPVIATTSEKREKNITFQDDQYWYWTVDENGNTVKNPISIVTQCQPVSYEDIREIPTTLLGYNYYYKVSQAYFCCKKSASSEDSSAGTGEQLPYRYFGWYVPSYPQNQDVYIPVVENDGKTATHYISDAEYKLTPGTGNYDFVPDDTAPEQTVEVDHMYYQGGYTNHDWFKQYVFHLEPGEEGSDERKQFDAFKIEVETMTLQEFNSMYGSSEKTTSETQSDDTSGAQAAETTQDINAAQSEEQSENQTEDQTTEQIEDQTVSQNEGDTSEVDQMVSEAGVELVSIEKELAETTGDSTFTDKFQDGTSVDSQTTEDSAQTTNNISDTSSQTTDSASDVSSQISDETDTDAQFTDNSADAIDDAGAFSAGDTVASNTSGKLAKYGLIYVNSSSINQAVAKEMSNIPTIINAAKLTDNSTTAQSFAAYIKGTDQDSDGHYVNTLVYVFKNTFAETNESTHQSSLINVNFHTNFNPNASDDSGSTTSAEAIQGFEEILEYIESENKYRKLGQTTDSSGISDGSDEISDGETVTPTPANAKIPLLKKDISQARAIEYIINYNLKRALNTKKSIRVLEIEPAKISDNKNGLTSDKVSEWLEISVPEIMSSKVCCTGPNQSEKKENMFDGKDNDNIWHSAYKAHPESLNNGHHYINLTLKNPASLSGFDYKPRTKSRNGKIVTFQVVLKFQNGETHTENGEFKYNNIDTDTTLKKFRFADDKVYQNVTEMQINIITAGNAETNKNDAQFASCSELSLVSETEVTVDTMTAAEFVGHTDDIGSKYDMIYIGDQKNNDHDTDLLTGSGEMCYAHVGATRNTGLGSVKTNLLRLIGQLDKDYQNNNPNANCFAAIDTYNASGAGYFRGSGNDITPQICSELKEFVQSGYPVVFASDLMKQNQDNKSRAIDEKKVDASSYYYEFMSYALKYDNVFASSELEDSTDKLTFFSNLAKPVIKFTSKPPEPPRANDSSNVSNRALIQDGQLKYVFSIENDSDAAPAVTTYDCNLYLDLNFDGNLSEKEDQSAYIQIADSSGQVLSTEKDSDGKNHYHLRAGQKYTLTRKLPESYYKIITWKLEISSNRNSYIHTSKNGYAKQGRKEGVERQNIKVLQLLPKDGGGKWDLSSGLFQTKLAELKKDIKINFDFDIQVTTTTVNTINAYKKQHEFRDILNGSGTNGGYDILIIGFDDVYSNIDNTYAQVDDILDFIKSGKSVIFSHDTTSFINYNETVTDLKVYINSDHSGTGQYYSIDRKNNWGLYLNKLLRSVVGMDRYGITSNEYISGKDQKVSDLLRKGNELKDGEFVSFKTLMELAGDVAYKNGTRSQSYAQTQGYSNSYMSNNPYIETTSADKVNDGAITQYPYVIGDKIQIGTTHSQYYQLGLEQDRDINGNPDGKSDVVVWYTLAGGQYDNSPRDVRNQYYFYSKGNVIYTGAGHKTVGTCEEEVNLFINAITAAANVTAVEPKASFVKTWDPNAGVKTTEYYMTDQDLWNGDANLVNKNNIDLYLNIKEYNMVSASLNQDDLKKQEMTIQFYIEDESGGTEQEIGNQKVRLTDITGDINEIQKYSKTDDKTYNKTSDIVYVSSDGIFHTTYSSVYALNLSRIKSEDGSGLEHYLKKSDNTYRNNCKVYAKVSSTVYLYGKANTRTVWTSINLKQRQLFDLD